MPMLLDVIHGAEQIDDFLVAPVGEDRLLVGAAAAVAAAVVDGDDDVAVGGEQLALEVERVLVLSVRAAVDAQQRRIAAPWRVSRRLDEQAVHLGAVPARRRRSPRSCRAARRASHASLWCVSWRSGRSRARGPPAACVAVDASTAQRAVAAGGQAR